MTLPIRVLVCGLTKFLSTMIVKTLSNETNLQVLASSNMTAPLSELAKLYRPDVIVTAGLRPDDLGVHRALLERKPRLRIYCIAPDGSGSWRRELRISTTNLGEILPKELVEEIRTCARRPLAAGQAAESSS